MDDFIQKAIQEEIRQLIKEDMRDLLEETVKDGDSPKFMIEYLIKKGIFSQEEVDEILLKLKLEEFDNAFLDGIFAVPKTERVKVRKLLEYCKEHGIQPQDIKQEDWKMFLADDTVVEHLVPKVEPSLLSYQEFCEHVPGDGQWEFYSGVPFDAQGIGRDTLALCLIYSMGLKHLVEILPEESKQALKSLLHLENDV